MRPIITKILNKIVLRLTLHAVNSIYNRLLNT